MAVGDPYSRMVQAMRDEGAHHNGFDMQPATVTSLSPLTINYNNTTISKGIYCSGQLRMSEDLSAILADEPGIKPALKQHLLAVYKELTLAIGDQVLVQRVQDSFYIVAKAVKQ